MYLKLKQLKLMQIEDKFTAHKEKIKSLMCVKEINMRER